MPPVDTSIQLTFQVCPIILTGGVASQIPGGMLPMLHLFSSQFSTGGLGLPFDVNNLDNAFGAFNVLPGGTLVLQSIAKYPFANQDVAANAVIREPNTISVIMDAPMRGPRAFFQKMSVMTQLKGILDTHNNMGGLYVVCTPAYLYQNLVMVSLTDNSRGNNSLPQNAWRFDFEHPLVALAELQQSYNSLLSKIGNQTQVTATQGTVLGIGAGAQTQLGDSQSTPLPTTSDVSNPQTGTTIGGSIAQTGDTLNDPGTSRNFAAVIPSGGAALTGLS